ncbi:hypothetical protein ABGF48_07725 [Helcococcus bovis]|uniref:hypothetical protein n=1 Tax=Helcococcus bovis TaxID=3153252 RepID=UPI0038BBE6BD
MSLGQSDSWWMDAIYNEIKERDAELIIYKFETYKNDEEKHKLIDEVKNKFINVCIRHEHSSDEEKNKVKNNIHVVIFNKNDIYFLGLEKK